MLLQHSESACHTPPAAQAQPDEQTDILRSLSLESTLQELTIYRFQASTQTLCQEIADAFAADPLLPGVVILEAGEFSGMISRRRFEKHLSHPFGPELFLRRSIVVLQELVSDTVLILDSSTAIATAASQALHRSSRFVSEPIVIRLGEASYGLLDTHHLLVAQAQIHQLTLQRLQEQTQAQLIQTEKMASLGQMVAGVAHEILNPINFIWGNVEYLANYFQDLMELLAIYETELPQASSVEQAKAEIEFDFLQEDLPQVIESIKLGSERLRKIVTGLKTFSHMDEANPRPADIHDCLDNTLLILGSRLKVGITVMKDYGELPLVSCYSGQLSQVFLNLIGNAIDALEESFGLGTKGVALVNQTQQPTIWIQTEIAADQAIIRIRDNGPGIPTEIQQRIFETFFTTKPAGKGTGLGLAISHQIIAEKHRGQINLRSQPELGTEFEVRLPIL